MRIVVEHVTIDDWKRSADLVTRYDSLPFDGTDASLMALAKRHHQAELATLDRQHLAIVRAQDVDVFTLVP